MINKIYINGLEVLEYLRGKSKNDPTKYRLIDGSFCTKETLKSSNVNIQCNGDGKLYKVRSITTSHLTKPYFGSTWRGIHQNPFKGKLHSPELKRRLSEDRKGVWGVAEQNAMFGKTNYDVWLDKYGKETADTLETKRREKFSQSISGKNNPFFGKHHSEETLSRLRESSRRWFGSLSNTDKDAYRQRISESQTKLMKIDSVKYRAAKARGGRASMISQMPNWKPNQIEKIVETELQRRNIPMPFGVILGHMQFDFGNKEQRVLLEVQGDYWHGNPSIYGDGKSRPLNNIQLKKIEKDRQKEEFCKEHGLKLFKIWESDIKSKNFSVLDELCKLFHSEVD